MFKRFRFLSIDMLAAVAMTGAVAFAQGMDDGMEPYGPQPSQAKKAKEEYESAKKKYAGNKDILVLPGIIADRKKEEVRLFTEWTGLGSGELVEFLLVDKSSSHGYESLLWSYGKPSDVDKALKFIGVKAGTPYNPRLPRLWADGGKVSVLLKDGDYYAPIERLIYDEEREDTLPEEGFVFSGSFLVDSREEEGEKVYVADAYDPRSVASVYNEPAAVLDVPREVNKGEAYGNHVVNPELSYNHGDIIRVVLRPLEGEDERPTFDMVLNVHAPSSATNASGFVTSSTGMVCRLSGKSGKTVKETRSLSPVMNALNGLRQLGAKVTLNINLGNSLRISEAKKVAAVAVFAEMTGVTKVRPPDEGELFYRGYVPNKDWRVPEKRPSQPWELHISQSDRSKAPQVMMAFRVREEDANGEVRFEKVAFDVEKAADVQHIIREERERRLKAGRSPIPPALLVFVDDQTTHGTMMKFVTPALDTHGTVYVFLDEEK